jgi:hypothetical protein
MWRLAAALTVDETKKAFAKSSWAVPCARLQRVEVGDAEHDRSLTVFPKVIC